MASSAPSAAPSAVAPRPNVRTRDAARARGQAIRSRNVGRPTTGAPSRGTGSHAQRTSARVTRNTAAATTPRAGGSNAGNAPAAALQPPAGTATGSRVTMPTTPSQRPSRIPRLSGGPFDPSHNAGIGSDHRTSQDRQDARPSTSDAADASRVNDDDRMRGVRRRLEKRREPREQETRE